MQSSFKLWFYLVLLTFFRQGYNLPDVHNSTTSVNHYTHTKKDSSSLGRNIANLFIRRGWLSCCRKPKTYEEDYPKPKTNEINHPKHTGDDAPGKKYKATFPGPPIREGRSDEFKNEKFKSLFDVIDPEYTALAHSFHNFIIPDLWTPDVIIEGPRYKVTRRDHPQNVLYEVNVINVNEKSLAIKKMCTDMSDDAPGKRSAEDILMGLWIEKGGMKETDLENVRFQSVKTPTERRIIEKIYAMKGLSSMIDPVIINRWRKDDKDMFRDLFMSEIGQTVEKLNKRYTGKVINYFRLTPFMNVEVIIG